MEGDLRSEDNKGIIPRAVDALFEGVTAADENMEFTFKVSYVEIYLEKIRDLLDENRLKVNLTIREDPIKGIYIAGVTEEYVTSPQETIQVMHAGKLPLVTVFPCPCVTVPPQPPAGAANRAVAATGLNLGSSRSHSVFTITVSQKDVVTSATKSGKLVLVDLAGSEMVRKSNATGQQLEEAKMINKSLSALGQVINALTDDKLNHVPYRDSKLTRILQDSLGGNSKTALIIAVSPSSYNSAETVSTLRFGTRAKSIENKVVINQTRSVEELEGLLVRAEKAIDAQAAHIITLSTQLQAAYAQLTAMVRASCV
jgi:kinesin family protein 5